MYYINTIQRKNKTVQKAEKILVNHKKHERVLFLLIDYLNNKVHYGITKDMLWVDVKQFVLVYFKIIPEINKQNIDKYDEIQEITKFMLQNENQKPIEEFQVNYDFSLQDFRKEFNFSKSYKFIVKNKFRTKKSLRRLKKIRRVRPDNKLEELIIPIDNEFDEDDIEPTPENIYKILEIKNYHKMRSKFNKVVDYVINKNRKYDTGLIVRYNNDGTRTIDIFDSRHKKKLTISTEQVDWRVAKYIIVHCKDINEALTFIKPSDKVTVLEEQPINNNKKLEKGKEPDKEYQEWNKRGISLSKETNININRKRKFNDSENDNENVKKRKELEEYALLNTNEETHMYISPSGTLVVRDKIIRNKQGINTNINTNLDYLRINGYYIKFDPEEFTVKPKQGAFTVYYNQEEDIIGIKQIPIRERVRDLEGLDMDREIDERLEQEKERVPFIRKQLYIKQFDEHDIIRENTNYIKVKMYNNDKDIMGILSYDINKPDDSKMVRIDKVKEQYKFRKINKVRLNERDIEEQTMYGR